MNSKRASWKPSALRAVTLAAVVLCQVSALQADGSKKVEYRGLTFSLPAEATWGRPLFLQSHKETFKQAFLDAVLKQLFPGISSAEKRREALSVLADEAEKQLKTTPNQKICRAAAKKIGQGDMGNISCLTLSGQQATGKALLDRLQQDLLKGDSGKKDKSHAAFWAFVHTLQNNPENFAHNTPVSGMFNKGERENRFLHTMYCAYRFSTKAARLYGQLSPSSDSKQQSRSQKQDRKKAQKEAKKQASIERKALNSAEVSESDQESRSQKQDRKKAQKEAKKQASIERKALNASKASGGKKDRRRGRKKMLAIEGGQLAIEDGKLAIENRKTGRGRKKMLAIENKKTEYHNLDKDDGDSSSRKNYDKSTEEMYDMDWSKVK